MTGDTAHTPAAASAPPVLDAPPDPRIRLRSAYDVWRRNLDVFLRLWTWLVVPNVLDMSMSMLAIGYGVGVSVAGFGTDGYAQFIAPGLVCLGAMLSAGFECSYGTYYRMEKQRTFDAIIATPVQLDDVVLGELMYGAFRGLVIGSVMAGIFGIVGLFASPLAILLVPLSALIGFMVATLAVCAAAVSPMLESLGWWVSFGIMPMFWVSGTFYRTEQFDPVVQHLQLLSPLYHGVVVARALAAGELHMSLLAHLAVLLAIGLAFALLAIRLMRRRLIR